MMRTNYDRLHEIAAVAARFQAPLRINVYQAVRTDAFALTYAEYWDGFARLFAHTDAIAIGEPLVRAMAGLPARRGGCGVGTVRVTPRATVQPCVYWGGTGQGLDTLIAAGRHRRDRALPGGPRPAGALPRLRPRGRLSRRMRRASAPHAATR